MPGSDGRLSPDELTVIRAKMAELWTGPNSGRCQGCGHKNWQIGDVMGAVVASSPGAIILGGASYPAILVVCEHCGQMMLLNANKLGITLPSEKGKTSPND